MWWKKMLTPMFLLRKFFDLKCLESTSTEFEKFMQDILEGIGGDFAPTLPGGGDMGIDGIFYRDGVVFQIYAPEVHVAKADLEKKMRDDFEKVSNWPNLREWKFIFRHRSRRIAYYSEILRVRDELEEKSGIPITFMTRDDVWKMFLQLESTTQLSLIGIPSLFYNPERELLGNLRKRVLGNVDDILQSHRLVDWEEGIAFIQDSLKVAILSLPELDENRYDGSDELVELDYLSRETFIPLIKCAITKENYRIADLVLSSLDTFLSDLKACKKEVFFSNWMHSFREVFYEGIKPILDKIRQNPKMKSYDSNLFNFIWSFGKILIQPMLKSIGIEGDLYTCFVGISIVNEIAKDGLQHYNEFHSYIDDEMSPLPFSAYMEPLLGRLSKIPNELSNHDYDISDVWYTVSKIEDIMCKALRKMIVEFGFDESGRIGTYSIFNDPLAIHSFLESGCLEKLLSYRKKPMRFQNIIAPIVDAIRNKSESMGLNQIGRLFDLGIVVWPIQKEVYRRISFEITDLCLECINKSDVETKFEKATRLAEVLRTGKEDMHYLSDLEKGVMVMASALEFGDEKANLQQFFSHVESLGKFKQQVIDNIDNLANYTLKTEEPFIVQPSKEEIETAKLVIGHLKNIK
jgi:hypothetical protein